MAKYYLMLYGQYFKMSFKSLLTYRTDFLIGAIGFIISTAALLTTLFVIFEIIDDIGGWSQIEVIFLFAFVSLSRSLWDTLMFNMTSLSSKIKSGTLDIYLLRPIDPLFQLISEKLDPDTIGEVIFSTVLLIYCLNELELLFKPDKVLLVIVLLISSVFCFAAIHLVVNSIAFWSIENTSLNFIVWRLDELTRYPLSIYPLWLKWIITLIPFGFVGYYPINLLLSENQKFDIISMFSPVMGLLSFFLAYKFWKIGLKKYESTGS